MSVDKHLFSKIIKYATTLYSIILHRFVEIIKKYIKKHAFQRIGKR